MKEPQYTIKELLTTLEAQMVALKRMSNQLRGIADNTGYVIEEIGKILEEGKEANWREMMYYEERRGDR